MLFDDQVVLITGASRGIGRACAIAFAAEGARVAIHYLSRRDAAEETRRQLQGAGHMLFQADVAQANEVEQLVAAVVTEMGGLHVLVNNAGIFLDHSLPDITYAEWQEAWETVLRINLYGPANLIYCAAHHMIGRGGGRIVNISSRGAFRGEPEGPAYGASKAGLNSLSQSLAQKLAPHNIFLTVVAPGYVETEMAADHLHGPLGDGIRNQSPFGRVAMPEEVARAALFLASPGTEFMTGCILDVNGASYLRT